MNRALCSDLADKMALGGKLTLVGILVVFLLLGLLVLILTAGDAVRRIKRNRSSGKTEKAGAAASDSVRDEECRDPEIVAAITAAVALLMESGKTEKEENNLGFTVKSIKKLNFRR